ncbi:MAG: 6-phosphogluconolactonase [Luteolibacter sp.]|uniref:6-phosphogluconolactonase n=1 Tax=Luteolibacter sp. TaxID=1962973 RepID=UPI0032663B8F
MAKKTIRFRIFENPDSASAQVAAEMALLIRERATLGRNAVIGFSTGKTPLPLFEELIYLYREEGLSFRNVISFNLDEYLGLKTDHPANIRNFMQRNLFDHIDIPQGNIHFLRGELSSGKIKAHCVAYEKEITDAGGIDFQILGIGRNGHIGFNEPGTPMNSRTSRVILGDTTREDAVPDFGAIENVPIHAVTMGCGTILEARKIILMAWGLKKSRVVRRAIIGPVTPKVTASYLKTHPAAQVFLDQAAASVLAQD